ncbi:sensor histidine kinase [Ferruginibacter sp. HRS2-29]|uniref:sensor histidine kinase n=1 Tax=Ferruginibacter sp. HRS2-29 TaxID=2487334 RepID=UPI0020CDAD28|nr:sensor histidine kinase [Ferruginibacter sp. HRS2-29]MCP9751965.1 histidine kinase [Ferruginibacter sp. HRS2-29]
MDIETLSEKLRYNKGLRIAAHMLFWTLLAAISWHSMAISFNSYNQLGNGYILLISASGTICEVLVYYPLVYFVFPDLFKKSKVFAGILAVLCLILFYTWLSTLGESFILLNCESCTQVLKANNIGYYSFLHQDLGNRMLAKLLSLGVVFGLIFAISIPLSVKFALQAFRQQIVSAKIARQNIELEYNFLKSQVHPHFLFNSLNNIYGLILKNENNKAAETVARLSEFMRYTLYYSTQDKMPLEKEIQLLKDYIELESIRLNHTKVNLALNVDSYEYDFPSLLLMPVVENAFKYNADTANTCITIQLAIQDNKLNFSIENTVDENLLLKVTGGIGLQNLKKRLDLYYRGKYKYETVATDTTYTAILNIDL